MRDSFSSNRPKLPSACATARSRNSSAFVCAGRKSRRGRPFAPGHNLTTLFRCQWGRSRDVLMLPYPFARDSVRISLRSSPPRMLVIDVFDDTAFFQFCNRSRRASARFSRHSPLLDRPARRSVPRSSAGWSGRFRFVRETHRPCRATSSRGVFLSFVRLTLGPLWS